MDFEREFQSGFDRHVHNLGFVPPEFRDKGRVSDEYLWTTTPARMRTLMSMREWLAIEEAAMFAYRTRDGGGCLAEAARERGGYDGLGAENFIIPDQRPLLQGGDNDPLD